VEGKLVKKGETMKYLRSFLIFIFSASAAAFAQKTTLAPPDSKEKLGSLAPLDLPIADEKGKDVTFGS
jgi:hypothetical protein